MFTRNYEKWSVFCFFTIINRRLYVQTVANYNTAGLLVGKWNFTLKTIIKSLIFNVEKEKLTI